MLGFPCTPESLVECVGDLALGDRNMIGQLAGSQLRSRDLSSKQLDFGVMLRISDALVEMVIHLLRRVAPGLPVL